MLNIELRNKIDNIWTNFWNSGITNPLTVIEQITYLMFMKQLDEKEMLKERISKRTGKEYKSIFTDEECRWSVIKFRNSTEMLKLTSEKAFPFIRDYAGENSTFSQYMRNASFLITEPELLYNSIQAIDKLPMDNIDIKGDLYEYLLSKLTTAGVNGQFRTPLHIRKLMVKLTDPNINDIICDPSCGTAGFLIEASDFILEKYTSNVIVDDDGVVHNKIGDKLSEEQRQHFATKMFYGNDFDVTMLRIAAMNCIIHGIEPPNIFNYDSLSTSYNEENKYTLVLANPPFKGNVNEKLINKSLKKVIKAKKTELLFIALILRILDVGGRCAIIVPEGVLTEASKKDGRTLREKLINENQLEAVISLPHTIFKPYASVATSILIFSKSGRTDKVWMYKLENDGYSDGSVKIPTPDKDDIPDILNHWSKIKNGNYKEVSGKHRFVDKQEIIENDYQLITRMYLDVVKLTDKYKYEKLGVLCTIEKGNVPASANSDGKFILVTTAEEFKKCDTYEYEDEAVCIPLVSSTGHGHASIKRVHYVSDKFSAATIMAVLRVKDKSILNTKYLYYILQNYKDEIIVPLMAGAANVSLSIPKIESIKIPLPSLKEQEELIEKLENNSREIIKLKENLKNCEENQEKYNSEFKDIFKYKES